MIAVGFLVSYDFDLLRYSLPLVYTYADKIVLAIDSRRKTFTGSSFAFDELFKTWIDAFDKEKKIQWLEEAFFKEGLTPFEVVLAKRNRMLEVMQPADWFIQLDADEYFTDFGGFMCYLKAIDPGARKLAVSVKWKTIFKEVSSGFLMIAGRTERIQIATNFPEYTVERGNEAAENMDSDFFMLHQSWARSESEIKTKVENWSHANDFDTSLFYEKWQTCNHRNYKRYINFHPIHNLLWPRLEKVKAPSIEALIHHYTENPPGEERPNPKPVWGRIKTSIKQLVKG